MGGQEGRRGVQRVADWGGNGLFFGFLTEWCYEGFLGASTPVSSHEEGLAVATFDFEAVCSRVAAARAVVANPPNGGA